jgi:hypothetical protein
MKQGKANMLDITVPPFPFLRLPREIRDCIYRHLLSARLTYTNDYPSGDHDWPFKFAPAILQANKQVSSEASQVLYGENDFVVLRVATHTEKYSSLDGFAHFVPAPSPNQMPQPVLEITITEQEVGPLALRTFIFTLGEFPYFIKHLWNKAQICDFYNSMIFELFLFNKAPSRHTLLNNQIVRSLDQI